MTIEKSATWPLPTQERSYALALFIIAFILFLPAVKNGLTNFDDDQYILANPFTGSLAPAAIAEMCMAFFHGHYHPLTLFSHALDVVLFDNNPKAIHMHSVLLHAINSVMVFFFFRLLVAGRLAAIAALLFAVHPITVETVAWASERKNLLYTTWGLVSLICYTRHAQTKQWKWYLFAVLAFVIALLGKSQAITVLLAFFAVDFATSQDPKQVRTWANKIPFILISIAFALVASKAQQQWGEDALQATFIWRLMLSVSALGRYVLMALFPWGNLSAYHPFPIDAHQEMEAPMLIGIVILVLAAFLAAVWAVRMDRILLFCIFFFLLTIGPMLKFLDIPYGRYLLAERYAYLPIAGLSLAMVVLWQRAREKWNSSISAWSGVVFVIALAYQTRERIAIWEDSTALWTDVIESYPKYEHPYIMRGVAWTAKGNMQAAMSDLEKAALLAPELPTPHLDMAKIHEVKGAYRLAIVSMNKAIQLDESPDPKHFAFRGVLKMRAGAVAAAKADLDKALTIADDAATRTQYGFALMIAKEFDSAEQQLDKAIALDEATGQALFLKAGILLNRDDRLGGCELLARSEKLGWKDAPALRQQQCRNMRISGNI